MQRILQTVRLAIYKLAFVHHNFDARFLPVNTHLSFDARFWSLLLRSFTPITYLHFSTSWFKFYGTDHAANAGSACNTNYMQRIYFCLILIICNHISYDISPRVDKVAINTNTDDF